MFLIDDVLAFVVSLINLVLTGTTHLVILRPCWKGLITTSQIDPVQKQSLITSAKAIWAIYKLLLKIL